MVHPGKFGAKKEEEEILPTTAALLCYICTPFTAAIFLLIEKKNEEIRFHAWQSIALSALFLVAMISVKLFAGILGVVADVLGDIMAFFYPILCISFIVLWITCMVKAYQGEKWKLPVIGDFAERQSRVS